MDKPFFEVPNRFPFTTEQLENFVECREDPIKFIGYLKLLHPAKGLISFDLTPRQKGWIERIHEATLATDPEKRHVRIWENRQLGLSKTLCGYAFWAMNFRHNQSILFGSNNSGSADNVISTMRLFHEGVHRENGIVGNWTHNTKNKLVLDSNHFRSYVVKGIGSLSSHTRGMTTNLLITDNVDVSHDFQDSLPVLLTQGAVIETKTG